MSPLLSKKAYKVKYRKQNGLCEICGRPPPEGRPLNVDHCHRSGRVRGLLCTRCNTALGVLESLLLEAMVVYLRKYNRRSRRANESRRRGLKPLKSDHLDLLDGLLDSPAPPKKKLRVEK